MAKDRRTKEQKRKAKLKERANRIHQNEVTPYEGPKYRAAEWTGLVFSTEVGIFETSRMTQRLSNEDVQEGIKRLVQDLRAGLPPLMPPEELSDNPQGDVPLLIWNIRRNWGIYVEKHGPVAAEHLVGVLRTLLNSIRIQNARYGARLGYLFFLEGFMKKLGVSVTEFTSENLPEALRAIEETKRLDCAPVAPADLFDCDAPATVPNVAAD